MKCVKSILFNFNDITTNDITCALLRNFTWLSLFLPAHYDERGKRIPRDCKSRADYQNPGLPQATTLAFAGIPPLTKSKTEKFSV